MTGVEAASKLADLRLRALVGVALLAGAALAISAGGYLLWVVVAAAALAMLAEWAGLVGAARGRTLLALVALAAVLLFAGPVFGVPDRDTVALLATAALALAVLTGGTRLAWGVVYAGAPAIAVLALRAEPAGIALVLYAVLVVVATDTGAYFAGRAIGGPKLAPRISPSKTWAGLVGGMVAAEVVGLAVARAGGLPATLAMSGAGLALLAQLGDLFESWLKRRAGVKDSGRLLPGHGGLLDRLDGLVPVACALALVMAA